MSLSTPQPFRSYLSELPRLAARICLSRFCDKSSDPSTLARAEHEIRKS
jgi:hypothetical protein